MKRNSLVYIGSFRDKIRQLHTDDASPAWFSCLPALPTERPSIRTPGHSAHHWPGVRQMVQCLLSSGERPILCSGWVSEAGSLGPTHCVCSVDDNDTMRQRVHWAPKKGMKGNHRDSRSPGPHWPFAGEAFCQICAASCHVQSWMFLVATFEFQISWNLLRCGSMCGECGNTLGVKRFIRFLRFRISIALSRI